MLITAGVSYQPDGAAARNWGKYGVAIEYKKDGIPEGAVIWVNPKSCASFSNNHVTFANGDCSPADLNKFGATVGGLGGNQSNSVKVSRYFVATICGVRWPKDQGLPRKVTKSVNCSGTGPTNESTR